jgi:hypothetical protein
MVRTTETELTVAGPRDERNVYEFEHERELLSFHAEYEQRLTRGGFTLRAAGSDRRSGRDRRQLMRPGAAERRRVQ